MADFIPLILLLLVVSISLGSLFKAIGLPDVVGAIVAGVIIGPAVFGFITPTSELAAISLLSLFFIILQIGIESSADIFSKSITFISGFAVTSFVVPFLVMAAGSFYLFHLPYLEAISVSLAVSIPSISITSVLLMRSGLIKIEDGQRLLGAVAMSDVLAFIILVSFHRAPLELLIISVSLIAFVIGVYYLDMFLKSTSEHIIPRLDRLNDPEKEAVVFAIIILLGLGISSLFEYIGISFVMGAFFAGLIIHRDSIGDQTYNMVKVTLHRINSSFFIPLFFSISGVEMTIIALSILPYLVFLLIVTIVIGGYAAYKFSQRYMKHISPTVSVGIFGGRGAVGIIIASIALSDGLMTESYYSVAIFATVIMAIAFTFVFDRSLKNGKLDLKVLKS